MPPDRSFYFRGPAGKLNLRAQNVVTFMRIAEGIDDETWMHHLRAGEYSKWFREAIHSETVAAALEPIERDASLSPAESRKRVRNQIMKAFTLPA